MVHYKLLLFRLFLKELPDGCAHKYPANIKSKLEGQGSLSKFMSLTRKDISWSKESKTRKVKYSELPVSLLPLPKNCK